MKLTSKHKIAIGVAAFCLLYIILAMRPLGKELHFIPEWTQDIFHVEESRETEEDLIPFKLGQNIGYFTEDGRITKNIPFPYKASISDSYYTIFGANNTSADFYKCDGSKAGTIELSGFPYFDGDRVYLFLPGGNSFIKCDETGKAQWKFENYAPITAFSSSKGGTIAGYADGTLISFNNDGSINHRFSPKGSKYEIIFGAGISSDGSSVACISGRDRQRFVVARKEKGHSRIVFHEYLNEESSEQELVKYSLNDRAIYYSYKDNLGIYSFKDEKSFHIPMKGNVVQIEESDSSGLVFVLSREDSKYTVTVLEKFNHIAAKFSFDAECAFIQARGDNFFVGRNSKISRLTVSKK
ncbi:hypothetical protein [Treponema sp.]|uniref:hypothetical protein n=1 Tax=Treponema sp. TaxID=166 RepID=UPI0025E9E30F|nr:hypothetical protein [Treponema sp.]MCR5219311.1 hypothetical protein [Treponema sp.]